MSLLRALFGTRPKSAAIAKDRLQLIIARERSDRSGADWLPRVEAVTCVPTHWRRQIRARLNPAAELASYAARRLRLPYVRLMRRVRAGPHQIGLSYDDRLQNIVGVFALRRRVQVRSARLLIIDDVRTTGATLNECAKVLRRAGAAETYGAVVVRGRPQHAQSTVRPL